MFTGIVSGMATLVTIERKQGLHTLTLAFDAGFLDDITLGASVAVDGVCLTVVAYEARQAVFDVMLETLQCTTLGTYDVGQRLNVERAAREGVEIGGHPLSGHVDCTACLVAIDRPDNNTVLTFQMPADKFRYIFTKGYLAVNGASLTIASVDKARMQFSIWLIPETLRLTTFSEKTVGNAVNIEMERTTVVQVDTIRDYLDERLGALLPQLEGLLAAQGQSLYTLASIGFTPTGEM